MRLATLASALFIVAGVGAATAADDQNVETLLQAGRLEAARAQAETQAREPARWVAPTSIGAVKALAWAPNGRSLLVAYHGPVAEDERGVSLVEADGLREILRLGEDKLDPVDAVSVSSSGTLATASFKGGVHLWERDGRMRSELECGRGSGEGGPRTPNGATGVALSPDGKRIVAACTDGSIRIWQAEPTRTRPVRPLRVDVPFSSFVVAPDGDLVAFGATDGQVGVGSVARGLLKRLPKHPAPVTNVALNQAGTVLVSSSNDGEVRISSLPSGKLQRTLRTDHGLAIPAALAPDGKLVVTGGPGGLRFWEAASGEIVEEQSRAAKQPLAEVLSFQPGGSLLAVGGPQGLEVWDVNRRQRIAETGALGDTGSSNLAFAPGGARLAIAGADGLRVWTLAEKASRGGLVQRAAHVAVWRDIVFDPSGASAKLVASPAGDRPHANAPSGKLIAVGDRDGRVSILDRAGRVVRSLVDRPPTEGAYESPGYRALGFSPDGSVLVAGADNGRVVLWDPLAGRRTLVLRPEEGDAVTVVAVSTDGRQVAVGTTRGQVEIWEVASRKRLQIIRVGPGQPQAMAFSPDGTRMAVGLSRRGTLLFALPSYEPVARLTAVPDRDATFWEALPGKQITSSGAESGRFLACRAGRFVLPAACCKGR